MNTVARPTIAEIRDSLSDEKRLIEMDVWAIHYGIRPLSVYVAWLFIQLGVSCKQTVALGLLLGLLGIFLIAVGSPQVAVAGIVLLILGSLLDYVDGNIARATGTTDKLGAYLDLTADNLMAAAVPIAVGIGAGLPLWGVVLALLYTYSTLSIMDGRQVFDDDKNVYRGEGWNLWRLAFVSGTNVQSLHLPILLVFAVAGHLEWYLYAFTTVAASEIVAIIYRRLQGAGGE
ncbi:MAG: CDP-alcohol phosphatidyltransferase family protein [Candidatus Bathyanammoxibius sp.]